MWLLAAVGVRALLAQQVEPIVTLIPNGVTSTLVTNTGAEAQAVTVTLYATSPDGVLPDTTPVLRLLTLLAGRDQRVVLHPWPVVFHVRRLEHHPWSSARPPNPTLPKKLATPGA